MNLAERQENDSVCMFVFIYIHITRAQTMMNQDYIIRDTNEHNVLDSS